MKKLNLVVTSLLVFSGTLVLGCVGGEITEENDDDMPESAGPSDEDVGSEETGAAQSAINGDLRLINQATGRCLDSNAAGSVYTLPCNGGANQDWFFTGAFYTQLTDKATGRVLDSNMAGSVYTLLSNGGNFQRWF